MATTLIDTTYIYDQLKSDNSSLPSIHDLNCIERTQLFDYSRNSQAVKRIFYSGSFNTAAWQLEATNIEYPEIVVDVVKLAKIAKWTETEIQSAKDRESERARIASIALYIHNRRIGRSIPDPPIYLLVRSDNGNVFGMASNYLVAVNLIELGGSVYRKIQERELWSVLHGEETGADKGIEINEDVTMGADPELSMFSASETDDRDYAKHVDASPFFGGSKTEGSIGTDGCSAIFEIRPEPAKSAKEFADNIASCLNQLSDHIHGIIPADSHSEKPFYLEAGGGFTNSLGGHIHIGNTTIHQYGNDINPSLGSLYDHFLYFPIRERMFGAARCWSEITPIRKARTLDANGNQVISVFDTTKDIIKSVKAHPIPANNVSAGYDQPGQFRMTDYGFEYRSLPSFIVNREFTELVGSIMLGITKYFLKCLRKKVNITFNVPPRKSDYLKFISEDEFARFVRYVNGDKRDAFLHDVLRGWNIDRGIVNLIALTAHPAWGDTTTSKATELINNATKDWPKPHKIRVTLLAWPPLYQRQWAIVYNPRRSSRLFASTSLGMDKDSLEHIGALRPNKQDLMVIIPTCHIDPKGVAQMVIFGAMRYMEAIEKTIPVTPKIIDNDVDPLTPSVRLINVLRKPWTINATTEEE